MAIQPSSLRSRGRSSPLKAKVTPAIKVQAVEKPSRTPKQQASFSLFSRLPTELRLKIWNLSLPKPRLVPISCGSKSISSISLLQSAAPLPRRSSLTSVGCASSAPIPTNLHTSAESRSEALKIYRPSFGFARSPGHILFDSETDIMYFGPREGYMEADSQFHTCMTLCDPVELAQVRRLAISDALFWVGDTYRSMTAASLTTEVLRQIATRMTGLTELIFVPREEEVEHDCEAAMERMAWQIQTATLSIKQQYPSWDPPPWTILPLSALPTPCG